MDPFEVDEFFELSEHQRSHYLFMRLKHLEQEVADAKMMLASYDVAGRTHGGDKIDSLPAFYNVQATEHELKHSTQSSPTHQHGRGRGAMAFTMGAKALVNDRQRREMVNCNSRVAANDRPLYLQKLIQVDNLCKEEMAKVATARRSLEPLNQMASDWKVEAGSEDLDKPYLEGEERSARGRNIIYSEDLLASLASTSKSISSLELSKIARQVYETSGINNYK